MKTSDASTPLFKEMAHEVRLMQIHYPESTWSESVSPGERDLGTRTSTVPIFHNTRSHCSSDNSTAVLLTVRPHFPNLAIDEVSQLLSITDLRQVLGDFFFQCSYVLRNGRRISRPDCALSFSHVHVWLKFRMQQRSLQDPSALAPPQMVQAAPPGPLLPYGQANTVLIAHESGERTLDILSEHMLFPLPITNEIH